MRWLLLLLLAKMVILGLIMGNGSIGLAPDEAQYWTWSQDLDWGYYSKPPGIAWQIWLTTALGGHTPLGVRWGALLIGAALSLAVYGVARAAGLEKKTALWAGVVATVCPLGVYLSFVATTDGMAILLLTLAVVAVMRGPHYVVAGLCILGGALFKWTALLFWPILLPFLLFFKSMRTWTVLVGIALSLLAFVPTLYWNMSHEWATFKHVGTAVGERSGGNFFDFLAAQMGLLSPVYFILLILSYFFMKGRREMWLPGAFPAVVLLYLGLAFFKKMQPNWAAFLYPPGLMLVAWVGCEQLKKGKRWLHIGTWVSIAMVTAAFMVPWVQAVPYKLNPFRQSMGWNHLSEALEQAGYHPQDDFLFADKYQNASLLSFYSPGQKRAYFFNISGSRKNQFSYWPQMSEREVGKTGYFVVLENMPESDSEWYISHYKERLAPYFAQIDYQGAYPLYSAGGKPVKFALIFKAINYSGAAPADLEKY